MSVCDLRKVTQEVKAVYVPDRRGSGSAVLSIGRDDGSFAKLHLSAKCYVVDGTQITADSVREFNGGKKYYKLWTSNMDPSGAEDDESTADLSALESVSQHVQMQVYDLPEFDHPIRDEYRKNPLSSPHGFLEDPVGSKTHYPVRRNADIGNGVVGLLFKAKSSYNTKLPYCGAPTIHVQQKDGTLKTYKPNTYELKIGQEVRPTFSFYAWCYGMMNVSGVNGNLNLHIVAQPPPIDGTVAYASHRLYKNLSSAQAPDAVFASDVQLRPQPDVAASPASAVVLSDDSTTTSMRRAVSNHAVPIVTSTVHAFQDCYPRVVEPEIHEIKDESESDSEMPSLEEASSSEESDAGNTSVGSPLSSHKRIRRRSAKRGPASRRRHTEYSSPNRGKSCDDEFSDELPFSEGLTTSSNNDSNELSSFGHAVPQSRVLSLLELEASCSDGSSDEMPSLEEASSSEEHSEDGFIVSDSEEVPIYTRKSRVVFSSEED